jgi:hypothetical protein
MEKENQIKIIYSMAIVRDGYRRTLMYTTRDTKLVDTNTHAQTKVKEKLNNQKLNKN